MRSTPNKDNIVYVLLHTHEDEVKTKMKKREKKKTLKSRREREKTGNLNTTSPVHWFTSRLPSYTWKLRKKKNTHTDI